MTGSVLEIIKNTFFGRLWQVSLYLLVVQFERWCNVIDIPGPDLGMMLEEDSAMFYDDTMSRQAPGLWEVI